MHLIVTAEGQSELMWIAQTDNRHCPTCEKALNHLNADHLPHTIDLFRDAGPLLRFDKHQILFVEGSMPHGVFLLCCGKVKIFTTNRNGKVFTTRFAGPGDFIGAPAVLSGRPYQLSSETNCASHVRYISKERFTQALKGNAELCLQVAKQISAHYLDAWQLGRWIKFYSVPQRLAIYLLALSKRDGRTVRRLDLQVTHRDLAELLGATRETISRTIESLAKAGVLEVKGSTIWIRKRHYLNKTVYLSAPKTTACNTVIAVDYPQALAS